MDRGADDAKAQAAATLRKLGQTVPSNQMGIALAVGRVMSNGGTDFELECCAQLASELAEHHGCRDAMADAGLIPHLVQQIEVGSDTASDSAVHALSRMAQISVERRAEVTQELISARHYAVDPKKRQRAGRALSEMKADDGDDDSNDQELGLAIIN